MFVLAVSANNGAGSTSAGGEELIGEPLGTPKPGDGAYFTQSMSQTSSIVPRFQYIERALAKADNTPAGILFPEYPTALIELEPDKVITDLRDKKLIT